MTGHSAGKASSSSHPHVNIWPRPYQQPRPEFWAATSDLPTCAELGRRGIVNTLLFGGYDRTGQAFDAYKQARAERAIAGARRGPLLLHGVLPMSAIPTKRRCASVRRSPGS